MSRFCMECNEPVQGRSDKRFCDDGCRSAYHNQVNAQKLKDVYYINKVLQRNLRILNQLNPNSKSVVAAKTLYAAGLNVDFYTHIYILRNGKRFKFCYHQGYAELDTEHFQLLKREVVL